MKKTLSRMAALVLVPSASVALALAGSSPASALYDDASLTCSVLSGNTLNAPVNPTYPTYQYFYYNVGNGWVYFLSYSVGMETYRSFDNGATWSHTDWAGGSYSIFDDHVSAWTYTFRLVNNSWQRIGWKNLGSC